jgi:hypothetical protein
LKQAVARADAIYPGEGTEMLMAAYQAGIAGCKGKLASAWDDLDEDTRAWIEDKEGQ